MAKRDYKAAVVEAKNALHIADGGTASLNEVFEWAFKPQVMVTQHGCDTHALDPLAHLEMSVDGQAAAALRVVLGVGQGDKHYANVEVKYSGPDNVMVDVSETGWVGTSGFSA